MASLAFRSACFSGDSFFILLPRLLCVLVILLRRFFCSNLLRFENFSISFTAVGLWLVAWRF